MSENDQDTMAVEDRLRSSLSSLASTTAVAPDGWDAIESRVERRRRRRTFGWAVGGPAVALAAVALFVAVLPAGDKEPSVVAGPGEPAAPARYAPQGDAPEVYTLLGTETGGTRYIAAGASSVRVYGHRARDEVTLDQVLMVITLRSAADATLYRATLPGSSRSAVCPNGPGCEEFPTASTQATLRGRQMEVTKGDRASNVGWDEPSGPTVGVMERGMGEDEYYAAVNGVKIAGGEAIAGTLPSGFTEVHAGGWPAVPGLLSPDVVIQQWREGAGDEFSLEVHQGAGVSLDTRGWLVADAEVSSVHDQPALYSPREDSLIWSPTAGVVLAVVTPSTAGMDEKRLRSLAESVEPITEEHWGELAGSAPVATPPIPSTTPQASTGTTIASGRVDGQDWTISHDAGTGGCFEVPLRTGTAGVCELDIAGPNEVGSPKFLGNLTTDGTLSFVLATVGSGVSAVRSEWSDGIAEWTDGPSARTGARIVDAKGALPVRLLIIPVANWSKGRPTSLTGLGTGGNDLNRQDVAEPAPCWPVCNQSPATTAG